MTKRVTVLAVVFAGWVTACGSTPSPPPVSPSPSPSPGTAGGQGAVPTPAPLDGSAAPAPLVGGTSKADVAECLGKMSSLATDACKSCVASSCLDPIKTVGAACPDFSKCVCDGNPMSQCAPSLLAAGCGQAGMAVGRCVHQSCAAQCPSPSASAAPTVAVTPGAAPAPTGGDPCTDLSACCAQMPGGSPASCGRLVATKNAQGCTALLSAFRNLKKCN